MKHLQTYESFNSDDYSSNQGIIIKKLRNPNTEELADEIYVKGKGLYKWNSVYNVYNNENDYEQLQQHHIDKIDWSKSN